MSRHLAVLSLVAVLTGAMHVSQAQTWVRGYFGTGDEEFRDAVIALDEATVYAGYTTSSGAGGRDVWIVKVSDCGVVEWQRTFGGEADDQAEAIVKTSDGGLVIVASTKSFGFGGADLWVLQLDADGNLVNDVVYGTQVNEVAADLLDLSPGFVVVANVEVQTGVHDVAVLSLKEDLSIDWSRIYGGNGNDEASAVDLAVLAGGYVVAGHTDSFGQGDGDFWLLQISATGDVVQERTYHGLGRDFAHDMQRHGLATGGYVVAGETTSATDGDEMWLLNLGTDLSVTWGRVFGGAGSQRAYAVLPSILTFGFTLVGENDGAGAGGVDAWLITLDDAGDITAQKTYGGTGDERAFAVRDSFFGGNYLVAGARDNDAFGLRLSRSLEIEGSCPLAADTGVADTALGATVGFPQSFSLVYVPGATSTMVTPQTSAASTNLVCTGRPSEVSARVPTEGSRRFIEPLSLGADDVATWEPAEFNCADSFNIYVGDLLDLRQQRFGMCLLSQVQQSSAQLTDDPLPEQGFFYFVSGVNAAGEGTLGFTSFGQERIPELQCLP